MPPPSKRLDLKVMVPEVMRSSRVRSAQPVAVPRSRASTAGVPTMTGGDVGRAMAGLARAVGTARVAKAMVIS